VNGDGNMNNEELHKKLVALQNGDKIVIEEIYKHLKKPMYTIILRITQDEALSEDILQEVFVKLYQSPPKSLIRNPRAYIFQIVRNLAIDSVKKQPKYSDLESIEDLVYLPVDDLSTKMDINEAMKTLSLQECQIVSFHVNGELKFREIADMMNIPLGTVFWKYQKAIKQLCAILSGGAL
jgi:RNA polymerase sigma-70 factor (ECF subfamily)